jgi:PAS domain S-box-containing protein
VADISPMRRVEERVSSDRAVVATLEGTVRRPRRRRRHVVAAHRRAEREALARYRATLQGQLGASERVEWELGERVKELRALHHVGRLLQEDERSTTALLADVCALLPAAWQYPHLAAARVSFAGETAQTETFVDSPWRQAVEFTTSDGSRGAIEVVYLVALPEETEGPFLAEERALITSLAEMLRSYFERTRAHAALRASEETYRLIVETSQDGILMSDDAGIITFANPRLIDMLGCEAAQVLGRPVTDFVDEEGRAQVEERFERRRRGEVVRAHYDIKVVRCDGTELWALVSSGTLLDQYGRFRGALATVVDITERRAVEELRHRRQQELLALVENAPDLISRFDRDLRRTYVNPAVERFTGQPASVLRGTTVREFRATDFDADRWEITLRQVLRTGREQMADFTIAVAGGERHFQARFTPEFGPDSDVVSVMVISRDITERARAEQERATLYRELLDRDARLHELVSRLLLDREADQRRRDALAELDQLTARELEILQLLAQGWTNSRIGLKLFLSAGTVKNHVTSILAKLRVADRTQAAALAVELGLLDGQRS